MHETPIRDLRREQARALDLVRDGRRFLLVGHERPDGDCLGAQAALAGVLEALGGEVWIVNTDPVPAPLAFLGERRRFRVWSGAALPAHDVAVLLDCSSLERCGALAAPLRAATSRKLVVDHHVFTGRPWWDAAYVDPSAAATGLLVRRMAAELGVALDLEAATGVFTSLVTDTGWFKYSNTDAETFAAASELTALGVDPARLFAAIFQRASRERPLGVARALARLSYHDEGRVALVALPAPQRGEAELDDGDEVLDLLRAVKTVEVALFLRETRAGEVRLSARSKGGLNVQELARGFGGGGHRKAAGATLDGPLDVAVQRVLGALEDLARRDEARSA